MIADDVKAIRERMAEIAAEGKEPDDEYECEACFSSGYICFAHPSNGQPLFRECDSCFNPLDLPRP